MANNLSFSTLKPRFDVALYLLYSSVVTTDRWSIVFVNDIQKKHFFLKTNNHKVLACNEGQGGINIKVILIYWGFRPKPWLTFCLATKSKQKSQDYARLTRKTYVQLAETVQTRSYVAQTGQFLTPTSLVFRFTGRGRSLENRMRILYSALARFYRMGRDKLSTPRQRRG